MLELETASEPIRGTVSDGAGHERAYVGWLALIEALEELRGRRPEGDGWAGE
jgi:hypothetical protein